MRWEGFRKVRRQVCKRIERRRQALGLPDLAAYQKYLEHQSEEWAVFDTLCRVTISRFYRDRQTFVSLERQVLPALADSAVADGSETLDIWSAGCASGEEPYTLALLWELGALARGFPQLRVKILATDADPAMIERAREGCYGTSSLKELPESWRRRAFVERDGMCCLRREYKRPVSVLAHDVRDDPPGGPFHLLLCRNLVFTYFELELQRELCRRFATCLRPGGALVVGAHEAIPEDTAFSPWPDAPDVYRKIHALPGNARA